MRSTPVVAAGVDLDADGTPCSAAFGDRYHPRGGALAQARHVFLAGSDLPSRWQGRDRFVVLETGFGLGNNMLATWQAWRDDPQRCSRLHFVSIEAHPPSRATLVSVPRDAALQPVADRLVAAWPPLTHGLHRLAFDDERFELLLAFGDVAAWLPQLTARVDAFFLDGFAPARNPAMWEPRLFKAMARLAAPDATVATWTAAHSVREGLAAAGFDVRPAPGQAGKRDITLGRYAPRHATAMPPRSRDAAPAGSRVAVIGAGLAGSATAWALWRHHGIGSTVHEAATAVALGASNGAAGVFHGVVHPDDGRHARWHRRAAFAARDAAYHLMAVSGAENADARGLLRLQASTAGLAAMEALVDAQMLPPDYARPVDANEASAIAGCRIESPAWWFAGGGWLDPAMLVRQRLAASAGAVMVRTGSAISGLRRERNHWLLLDPTGRVVDEADVVVCCSGCAVATLPVASDWPLRRVRGQSSAVSFDSAFDRRALPRVPIAGAGYAVARDHRTLWFGATSSADDDEMSLREADDGANWQRVGLLLPELAGREPAFIDGRVGQRCTTTDRLPIIGAIADDRIASPRPEQPRHAPRLDGLHVVTALGSRGIASSALGGAIVAATIAGAPLPAEADLLDAVDPARFTSRQARRPNA